MPAVTRTLVGTILATWDDANFSPGAIPVTGDSLIVGTGPSIDLAGTTLDRTIDDPTNGLVLIDFDIVPGATIDIGDGTDPLKCIVSGELSHRGNGALYFNSEYGATGSATTGRIIVDSPNAQNALVLGGAVAIASVEVLAGKVIHSDAPVALVILNQQTAQPVSWESEANSTVGPTLTILRGGTMGVYGGATEVIMGAGQLTVHYLSGYTGPNLTMLGGYCAWNGGVAPTSPTGDPDIYLLGGVLDFTKLDGTTGVPVVHDLWRSPSAVVIGDYQITGTERTIGQ